MKVQSSGTGDIDFRLPNNGPIHARVTDAFQLESATQGQWGEQNRPGKEEEAGEEAKSAECRVRSAECGGIPMCERPTNIFGPF
jgi:hypothetical protein